MGKPAAKNKRMTAEEAIAVTADGEREVVLPTSGATVLVRSVSKKTMQKIRDADGVFDGTNIDLGRMEPQLFFEGLVDPKLTLEQVEHVFEAWPAGDIDEVLEAITEASGLGAGFREARQDRDGEE